MSPATPAWPPAPPAAQQQIPFTLPDGAAGIGNIRVTVTTDSGQTIKEYDSNGNPAYGNNTTSIDAHLDAGELRRPGRGLRLAGVTPGSPQSGGFGDGHLER